MKKINSPNIKTNSHFVLLCKHAFQCCLVGRLYGDWLALGDSLQWSFKKLQFFSFHVSETFSPFVAADCFPKKQIYLFIYIHI